MKNHGTLSQESLFQGPCIEEFELPGADLSLHKSVWATPQGDQLCQELVEELEAEVGPQREDPHGRPIPESDLWN